MANLSTLLGGGGLQSKPVLHVQDVKAGNVGGGFSGASNTPYTRDINRIVKNSITGATLTNDGTTSGTVGTVGTQGIVNNTDASTHVNSTYVTIPAGDYYYELDTSSKSLGNASPNHILYDKTAAADLSYALTPGGDATEQISKINSGYFTLSTSSNIDVRSYIDNYNFTAAADDWGNNSFGSGVKVCHLDLKIYKL